MTDTESLALYETPEMLAMLKRIGWPEWEKNDSLRFDLAWYLVHKYSAQCSYAYGTTTHEALCILADHLAAKLVEAGCTIDREKLRTSVYRMGAQWTLVTDSESYHEALTAAALAVLGGKDGE